MENEIKDIELAQTILKVCKKHQEERVSGQWYITQTGLNKVAKLIGGTYEALTKKQRAEFRNDCVCAAHENRYAVMTWWHYINI